MPASNHAPARDRGVEAAPDALAVLHAVFGLSGFRGAQEQIVRHVTEGGNCLVLMPTGGGKSLCYQLPSLLRKGCGIVVSPLIALMRDQVAGLTRSRRQGRGAQFHADVRGGYRRRATPARRRPRSAVCRAGAAVDAALPVACSPEPRSRCLRSTKRIACRNGAMTSVRNISACP